MPTRRNAIKSAAAVAVTAGLAPANSPIRADEPPKDRKGRIKQSIVYWCFNARGEKWGIEKVCDAAKSLGCQSVEVVGPEHWATLKKHGLVCAIAPNGMPGAPFMRGFNNQKFHDELIERTGKMIDDCADAQCPSVISFVGYKWTNPDDPKSVAITQDEAFANCVKGLKRIAKQAEKKAVTICVEHLNTRDDTDPMKGHPGYQGDDLDFVASILKKVGSPRVKLLFDIYHVQLMHGDVIRRIEANKELIGHVHTAGVTGRGELDDTQEINYPPIIRKLLDVGYTGYLGQEFIPTRDPFAGLKQAVELCDV